MNVKKAVKRIGALAAGTSMVAATIMGAAANLAEYPAPFVKDYVFDGKIVVGEMAATSDVMGAIDIAASLQAAAKSPAGSGSGSESISIDGGVAIKGGSEDFNYGDAMSDFNSGEYDATDFPEILADGMIEDESGTEWDYEQTITVGDAAIVYGQDEDFGDDPVFYLDLESGSNDYIVFTVEFDETTDLAALQDSETIEMFGRSYTFDPSNADNGSGDLTLFGSDVSVQVTQGESVTVEVGGEEYTIELLGGNSDAASPTANLRVTGDGTETKSLAEGTSRTVAGLDLVIEDVFINNIGESSIAVNLFVGSNELIIPDSAISSTADSYDQVTINDDDNMDIYAWVDGADFSEVEAIHFRVDPTDFDNAETDNNWNWLPVGSTFTEDLFGFSLTFDGMTHAYGEGSEVLFTRDAEAYDITFTNNDGDEYSAIELYRDDGSSAPSMALGEDLVLSGNTLADEQIFIVEETESKAGESKTYVLQVKTIDGTDNEVSLRDLAGSTVPLQEGDEIYDTGYYIGTVGASDFVLWTDSDGTTANNVKTRLVTEGGLIINLDTALGDDVANLSAVEDSDDVDEATVGTLTIEMVPDADDDIALSGIAWSTGVDGINDQADNYEYGFSDYGTWYRQEIDNNGDDLTLYYSGDEADFNVFLTSPEAVVVRSGSNDGNAYLINKIGVGAAVLDSDAMGLIGRTNMIVVGGPCVNSIAAHLLGDPENCAEGFEAGHAMIKLFPNGNKVALLVAGYGADDTTAAARVLAEYADNKLSGDEVEVTVSGGNKVEVTKK